MSPWSLLCFQDEEEEDDEEDEDDEVNDSLSPIPLSITKHDLVQQDHELCSPTSRIFVCISMMTLCLHNQDEDDEEEEEEEGSEEEEEEEEEGGTTDEVASVDKGATPGTTGAR